LIVPSDTLQLVFDAAANTEAPRRLTPTPSVARDLYLRSGNRCAFPGCNQPLMTSEGVLVGEIAHIEAAMPGGPRFRDSMTNEERRAFENLLLVCATHHTVVDTDPDRWSVDALRDLKKTHEAVYTGAVDRLRSTVGDITEGTSWQSPVNLGRLSHVASLNAEELAADIEVLNDFARRLSELPIGARSVLAVIVARGNPKSPWGDAEVAIPLPLLEQIVDCSKGDLRNYLAVLEHVGLVVIDDPYDEPLQVVARNSTPGIGWPVMTDLHAIADADASVIRRVIIDLDFTVFDS
jgi:hypothetical protein